MGVTISSVNKSIDLGYFGFRRLRVKVAELVNEEIAEHYKELENSTFIFGENERQKFFKKYDAKTKQLDEKYDYKYNAILYFLYSSDCEATIDVNVCKELYEIIKDYQDDTQYGYIGRKDCATFNDFKEIIKDCIENNEPLEWF